MAFNPITFHRQAVILPGPINAPATTEKEKVSTPETPAKPLSPEEVKLQKINSAWKGLISSGSTLKERDEFIKKNFGSFENELNTLNSNEQELKKELNGVMEDLITLNNNKDNIKTSIKKTSFLKISDKKNLNAEKKETVAQLEDFQKQETTLRRKLDTINTYRKQLLQSPENQAYKQTLKTYNINLLTFQTTSFNNIRMETVVSPKCENIEAVQPDFSGSNAITAASSMQDPETSSDGTAVPEAKIEPQFAALQNTETSAQNISPDVQAGGATSITYAGKIPPLPAGQEDKNQLINCDAFHVETHGNYKLVALADGSSHGSQPRKAAQTAVAAAVNYMNKAMQDPSKIKTGSDIVQVMINATETAQQECVASGTGQTTFNLTFEYKDKQAGTVNVSHVSVGDSATFVIYKDPETGKCTRLINMSEGSRNNDLLDCTNSGGALGKCGDPNRADREASTAPDLGNLSFNSVKIPANTQYCVMSMSDGVLDNLHPYNLGVSVEEARAYIGKSTNAAIPTKWSDISDEWKALKESNPEELANLIAEYQAKKFEEIYNSAAEQHGPNVTVQQVADKVIEYTHKILENVVEATNEAHTQPPIDYKAFAGKMDHVTIGGYQAATPNIT